MFLARLLRRRSNARADREAALRALHELERSKAHLDRYDRNPNEGYAPPFDGGQTPGFNPGGPF